MNSIEIKELLNNLSSDFNSEIKNTAIILAAGHGKRIKSNTSKMLHKILEIPTVNRVVNACENAIEQINTVVVVGIKADSVSQSVGKKSNRIFAFQEEQKGTGHAVQVAINSMKTENYDGNIFILPGDMGLFDVETMRMMKDEFENSDADMIVLTGLFEGNPTENSYGRIVRVPEFDVFGEKSQDFGKVFCILENKDIHSITDENYFEFDFNGKKYRYSKQELINNNEFNSGAFVFNYQKLVNQLFTIDTNNAQGEVYLTDLIELFNKQNWNVRAVSPKNQYVVMGFNTKSVLSEMNAIAYDLVYQKIKDLVEIEDPKDFFISENIVKQILDYDKQGILIDLRIGKGSIIKGNVKLNKNLFIERNVTIAGNVSFGENVLVKANSIIGAEGNKKIIIGNNVNICGDVVIKGDVEISDNVNIRKYIFVKGLKNPSKIGKNVEIKGFTTIEDSIIGENVQLENCFLRNQEVESGRNICCEKLL